MSGANTPRSKKRLRQALIDMMKAHQSGKQKLPTILVLKVIDRIGVLDGQFPPDTLVVRPSRKLGRYAESAEIPDEEEYVKQLKEEASRMRGGADGNTHRD